MGQTFLFIILEHDAIVSVRKKDRTTNIKSGDTNLAGSVQIGKSVLPPRQKFYTWAGFGKEEEFYIKPIFLWGMGMLSMQEEVYATAPGENRS